MFVLLSTQSFYLIAQGPKIFDASFLQLEWELVKDVTAGDPHFNAVLILNNKGGVVSSTQPLFLFNILLI